MSENMSAAMKSRRGPIGEKKALAIRRRAMKRWLRAHSVEYSAKDMYRESALRKLVRDHVADLCAIEDARAAIRSATVPGETA